MVARVPCISTAWPALLPCGPGCVPSSLCTSSPMKTAASSAHGPPLHLADSTLPSSLFLVLHDMSQEVPVNSECAYQSLGHLHLLPCIKTVVHAKDVKCTII